jgi:hypothetical protein
MIYKKQIAALSSETESSTMLRHSLILFFPLILVFGKTPPKATDAPPPPVGFGRRSHWSSTGLSGMDHTDHLTDEVQSTSKITKKAVVAPKSKPAGQGMYICMWLFVFSGTIMMLFRQDVLVSLPLLTEIYTVFHLQGKLGVNIRMEAVALLSTSIYNIYISSPQATCMNGDK